jgi:soluble lytic murein transglycosylase-like protein
MEVNLRKIVTIESGWNPLAENKSSDARGLAQITKVCLEDYNQFNPVKFEWDDMFNPLKNLIVANWYLNTRIPWMLAHYRHPVTLENILVAYNAGISWVGKESLPAETVNYIRKFKEGA